MADDKAPRVTASTSKQPAIRSSKKVAQVPSVAKGGLLDRRAFLARGLAASTLVPVVGTIPRADAAETTETALPWTEQPGALFSNYGQPSAHEAGVIRWISANSGTPSNGISWSPLHELEGSITPNGLHFERHHNGVPQIDPAQHRLQLHGLVEQPLEFSVEALRRYPMVSHQLFIECGGNSNAGFNSRPIQSPVGYFHGLVSCSEWVGVPVRLLLAEAGLRKGAPWAIVEGADALEHHMSVPTAKLLDDAFIALYQNGERLRPENGYPLRLICPGYEGVLNVKWVKRIELSREPAMSRNETARYTELQPDGRARAFTFVMEAKSLITKPSVSMTLPAQGYYEIIGLAWSGRGRITRVEVSADAGDTWAEASLDEPIRPRCFTRFRIPWHWHGQTAILKSRATDETGYVQPERDALVGARGRHGYFHNNAIVAWQVEEDGFISHVYA